MFERVFLIGGRVGDQYCFLRRRLQHSSEGPCEKLCFLLVGFEFKIGAHFSRERERD